MVSELVSEIRCVYNAIDDMAQEEFNGGMALYYSSNALCPTSQESHLVFQSNGKKTPEGFEQLLKYTKQALLINDANRILEENADLEWILEKRFRKMKKWEAINLNNI